MKAFWSLLLVVALTGTAFSAEPDKTTTVEIAHLLTFIKSSNCDFSRNGTWYSAPDAADHINKKYQYVLKKGLVGSSEDFIKYAATKSSMSGKKYTVQCEEYGLIETADWLSRELLRYRSAAK
ncbi:MAG: DUF5329 family protein [Desulfuromonadaceae bacterium]